MKQLIKILAIAIMIAAGVTSYHTQLEVFLSWKVDMLTALIAPISIDMLAVICSVAVHLPDLTRKGRVIAVCVLVVAGSGSMAANWMAGSTVGAKSVHLAMVAAYLLAETVASQMGRNVTPAAAAVKVPEVEVQQAEQSVSTKRRGAYGPRVPAKGYSKRQLERLAAQQA